MQRLAAPILAAILLLLPLLYVGSYFALVKPGEHLGWGSALYAPYRCGGDVAVRLFWPLEQIDRRVRPGAWEVQWFPQDIPALPVYLDPSFPAESQPPVRASSGEGQG